MKKIIAIILAIAIAVTCICVFTGCKKDGSSSIAIGVQAGTTGEAFVKGDADWGFSGIPNATASSYTTIGLAVQEMISGNINYAVVDKAVAEKLVQSNKDDIKMIDIDLTVEKYAIGISKDNDALKAQINTIIANLKSDGTLDAIYEAYANIETSEDETTGTAPDPETGFVGVEKGNASSSHKLVIATNAQFAPYEYKIGNKFYGIDMEIAKIIAGELGYDLYIDDMEFDAVVTAVQSGDADLAIACLTVNAKREKSVNFSDAYEEGAAQVLIVKKSDTAFDSCKTTEDVMNVFKNMK